MGTGLYEKVTFANITAWLNKGLGVTYAQIAQGLSIDVRTLNRWRRYGTYKSLRYHLLIHLLKEACKENNLNFLSALPATFIELPKLNDEKKLEEKIIEILAYRNGANSESLDKETESEYLDAQEFIENCLNQNREIESIQMAFQSGWKWLKSNEKMHLLESLEKRKISLYIIVNTNAAVQKIAETMADPNRKKFYMDFDSGVKQWDTCIRKIKNADFRVSEYPILRKTYIVNYKNGDSEALIRDYAYAFSTESHEGYYCLTDSDVMLPIFKREFKYLWENGEKYKEWLQKMPPNEEKCREGTYMLLYLSHKKLKEAEENQSRKFIVSMLQIHSENKIDLRVNIASRVSFPVPEHEAEYYYTGTIKVTRNNLYMLLKDKNQLEQISIIISRPLYDKKRYIGIMTALSPQAQPVAFKCACIEYGTIINTLDQDKIIEILESKNKNWGNNLIMLEEQETNRFYSNDIFIES